MATVNKIYVGNNNTAKLLYEVKPKEYGIVQIGSDPALTRTYDSVGLADPVPALSGGTGSSPFDSIYPWSDMVIEERAAGTMVKIPKFYYRLRIESVVDGLKHLTVRISNKKLSEYKTAPAHMDRGDGHGERDTVYIGRYHCASDYKSKAGVLPITNITRSTARDAIHSLGENVWQMDYAMRFTIWLLYMVEMANLNSQAVIGYGKGTGSLGNMGYTDSMQYHTGTMQSSRTTYGFGTQYRNIEGLWDNCVDWMDGCYNNSDGFNLILNPNNFNDSTGGVLIGKPSNGFPSYLSAYWNYSDRFDGYYPNTAGGSNTTYFCDTWQYSATGPCICVGGTQTNNQTQGLFSIYCGATTYKAANWGCRLMELP